METPPQKRPKRVTLQDIADAAGVQRMAVSNALNGKPNVSAATREKVLRIAREMHYVPNFAARSLRTERTGIIAVLTGSTRENYYGQIVQALQEHIVANGYNMMLMMTAIGVQELAQTVANFAVDGVIAVDMLELASDFSPYFIPYVSMGTYPRDFIDNVVIDLGEALGEATQLMVNAGRKRIAYVVTTGYLGERSEVRAAAYLDVIEAAGLTPEIINADINNAPAPEFGDDSVEVRLKAYFQEHGCPDGLVCLNDDTAMSAFRVLKELGYRVPEDVLLVGCDGQQHMKDFNPPLSTIDQPIQEMCDIAWKFLEQRMTQPDSPHQAVVLKGKLIVRESLLPASEATSATLEKASS